MTAYEGAIRDPEVLRALRQIERDFLKAAAFRQYQYLDVTFNSTANADTDIVHKLLPATPEDIDFQVVRLNLSANPTTVPVIYRDTSSDRRAWGDSYIVLRCNVASTSATLLLTVRR
jgi:hypothetical protein